MALVDYSSSDADEEEVEDAKKRNSSELTAPSMTLKRKRESESASVLPPLPSKFHDLYASTSRLSTRDDPSLHGGRKRVIPHIEGNWPTHLYIEWYPSTTESSLLTTLISKVQALDVDSNIQSSLTSELDVPLPLHISLSRSLGFSAEKKGEFVDSLAQAIQSSRIRPFYVQFTGLDWVANFEKTRWFLVLRLQKPDSDGLNQLLHLCNAVAEEHGQPPLYQSPRELTKRKPGSQDARNRPSSNHPKSRLAECQDASEAFHFSIAWTLSAPSAELLQHTHDIKSSQLDELKSVRVKINDIKAKVGNTVTSMALSADIVMKRSLFEV